MAEVTFFYEGISVPTDIRTFSEHLHFRPVLVEFKPDAYRAFIQSTSFDAYLIPRWIVEHDYGMPLPNAPAATVIEGPPRVPSASLPAGKRYIVQRLVYPGFDNAVESWRTVWEEVAEIVNRYKTVAAEINVARFDDSPVAANCASAFFAVLGPLAARR